MQGYTLIEEKKKKAKKARKNADRDKHDKTRARRSRRYSSSSSDSSDDSSHSSSDQEVDDLPLNKSAGGDVRIVLSSETSSNEGSKTSGGDE